MIDLRLGDCLEVLKELPSDSVQCCITSPPYWGLRNYGVEGQLGLEQTPDLYVEKLVDVFREVKRVLHPTGTLWLNLGDSYVSSPAGNSDSTFSTKQSSNKGSEIRRTRSTITNGLKPKDLVGIPWRVAFALQADGWWLRSDIIWAKGNPMPESVTDRLTKSHEYLFLLTKNSKYYYDSEAIKEPAITAPHAPGNKTLTQPSDKGHRDPAYDSKRVWGRSSCVPSASQTEAYLGNPPTNLGRCGDNINGLRNKRDVWFINTKPFKGAHFAVMPEALVEPCILAGTSHSCCPVCGNPYVRVTERKIKSDTLRDGEWEEEAESMGITGTDGRNGRMLVGLHKPGIEKNPGYNTLGWEPTCKHQENPIPCVVLDPFNGAGTTGVVAKRHNRSYIGIDLKEEYLEIARKRIESTQPLLDGL